MPAALLLAFAQIGDPAFRRPLLWGVLGAALAGGLLVWGGIEAAAWAAGTGGWLAWAAQAGGGLVALLLAWWLFLPVTAAIASQLVDPVAAAVERRHYPGLPPPRPASVVAQAGFGLLMGLRLLGLQILLLPLLLVPVAGPLVALAVAGRLLGGGMVRQTAMLRMDGSAAREAWRARQGAAWALGVVLGAMALVPPLNLLVPIIGTAAAVHVLHRPRRGG